MCVCMCVCVCVCVCWCVCVCCKLKLSHIHVHHSHVFLMYRLEKLFHNTNQGRMVSDAKLFMSGNQATGGKNISAKKERWMPTCRIAAMRVTLAM